MPNTEIKITAMVFNSETKWAYTEPKSVADLKNGEMFLLRKAVIFSVAFDEFARYLCTKGKGGQMPDSEAPAPIIILITDGMPTSPEWLEHLDVPSSRTIILKTPVSTPSPLTQPLTRQKVYLPNSPVPPKQSLMSVLLKHYKQR